MMITRVGNIYVRHDDTTVSWDGGMAIDADGSPFAYSPPGVGLPALDFLANAGHPDVFDDAGNLIRKADWYGLVCDENGKPYIQGVGDPAPGYFVSPTALCDKTKALSDPRRYVDSAKVAYVSVPPDLKALGVRMGDLCTVQHGMQKCIAIVADVSPKGRLGEASVACAVKLGIPSSPKNGGVGAGVSYSIQLGSAAVPPWPRVFG